MPKQINETGYRVVVYPRSLGDFGYIRTSDFLVEPDPTKRLKQYKDICGNIVADIRRHVANVGNAYVQAETEAVCSYCGSRWTEDTPDYNGGCCDDDEAQLGEE